MTASVDRWLVAALAVFALCVVPAGATASTENASSAQPWEDEFDGQLLGGAIGDAGYVLVGRNGGNGLAISTGPSGDVRYRQEISGEGDVQFESATALGDGSYVAVGVEAGPGRQFAVRLAENGTVVWRNRYGDGAFHDVELTADGRLLAVGGGTDSMALIDPKTGTLESRRELPGTVRDAAMLRTGSEIAVVVNDGRRDRPRVLLTDENGTVRSRHRFGDPGDELLAVDRRAEGGLVMAGIDFNADLEGRGWGVVTTSTFDTRWTTTPETVTLDAVAGPDGTIVIGSTGTDDVRWMRRNRTLARLPIDGPRAIERADGRVLAVGYVLDRASATVVPRAIPELTVESRSIPATDGTARYAFAVESNASDRLETYRWDFDGDGTVETTTNRSTVEHVFEQPGNYTAGLVAATAGGVRVRKELSVTATDRTPPTVRLSSPDNGLVAADSTTSLRANASTDNREITAYRWAVDGGVERTTEQPVYSYAFGAPNRTYTLDLTVVDANGNENTSRFEVRTARNDEPRIQRVTRSVRPASEATLSVTYRDRIGATTVTWRLPNATTKNGERIEHSFPESGRNYTVEVTVRDEYGASDSRTVELAVEDYPSHGITAGLGAGLLLYLAIVIGGPFLAVAAVVLLYVRED